MSIWEPDNFPLYLTFFLPGFISLRVYDLLVPSERRDFSKSLTEIVAYSTINFLLFYLMIRLIAIRELDKTHPYIYFIFIAVIFFIIPVLWPGICLRVSKWKYVSKYIVSPYRRPWDFKFSKKKPAWIIVHLKDGSTIGGLFGCNSFASSNPAEEQLYIEQLWNIDDKGRFGEPIIDSDGIIIFKSEMLAVEFFKIDTEQICSPEQTYNLERRS